MGRLLKTTLTTGGNIVEENMNTAEQPVSTPDTQQAVVEQPVETPAQPERTYTKNEIIDLMKKRVDRSHKAFFKRYGVNNLQELDDVFKYKDQYLGLQNKYNDLTREMAFIKNNVSPERYEDIIAYFKGKDLEFNEQELLNQLATHPEWLKQQATTNPQSTTIKTLGSEAHSAPKPSDKDLASKLLGVKL